MTPTRSSIGTRDLRMALILRASPLPAWINCRDKHTINVFFSIKLKHLDKFSMAAYMHLWSTSSQQVNKSRVKRHNGISQVNPVLLVLFLSSKPVGKNMSLSFCNTRADNKVLPMKPKSSYMGKRLSFLTLGPSLAGSSDILIASSIAARSPLPPSPLKAGPKHSGLRMRRRTTTFAFSSTLSPTRNRDHSSYRLLIRSRIRNNEDIKMKCYNDMLKKKSDH